MTLTNSARDSYLQKNNNYYCLLGLSLLVLSVRDLYFKEYHEILKSLKLKIDLDANPRL